MKNQLTSGFITSVSAYLRKLLHPLLLGILMIFLGPDTADAQCIQQSDIRVTQTSLGSPLDGPFQPNEIVSIELVIDWVSLGCNWLHGIVPTFGNGWNLNSFDDFTGEPNQIYPPLMSSLFGVGSFDWYHEPIVFYNNINSLEYYPGEPLPAGWFVKGTSPGPQNNFCQDGDYLTDPNCSCGIRQSCSNVLTTHVLHLTLVTSSLENCQAGLDDLSMEFKVFSDYETGSAPGFGCLDLQPISKTWALDCSSAGPALLPTTHTSYSNHALAINLNDFLVDPSVPGVTFNWEVESPSTIIGASSCDDNCGNVIEHTLINTAPSSGIVQYTVTAFDSDGSAGTPATFDVVVMSALEVIISEPGQICAGECVVLMVTATGGDGNYIYQWENGNGLSVEVCPIETRSYAVVVTDGNGDTMTAEVEIIVEDGPDATLQPQVAAIPCFGLAPSFLSFTTDASEFSFTWAGPGVTIDNMNADTIWPDAAGAYELTLIDDISGCSSIHVAYVTDHIPDPVTISTSESSVCWGARTYDILSAEPAGGIWTGNVNEQGYFDASELGMQTITYSYEDVNGCISTDDLTIEVVDIGLPDIEKTEPLLEEYCAGTTYTYCTTEAEEPATYNWETENADLLAITGNGNCVELIWQNHQIAPKLCVYYQTTFGCRSSTYCFEGINLVEDYACSVSTTNLNATTFKLFPNPIQNSITIQAKRPFENIQIFDLTGQMVFQKDNINSTALIIPNVPLPTGIYFISLNGQGLEKFVKL